jgi:hypothetical protein
VTSGGVWRHARDLTGLAKGFLALPPAARRGIRRPEGGLSPEKSGARGVDGGGITPLWRQGGHARRAWSSGEPSSEIPKMRGTSGSFLWCLGGGWRDCTLRLPAGRKIQ